MLLLCTEVSTEDVLAQSSAVHVSSSHRSDVLTSVLSPLMRSRVLFLLLARPSTEARPRVASLEPRLSWASHGVLACAGSASASARLAATADVSGGSI